MNKYKESEDITLEGVIFMSLGGISAINTKIIRLQTLDVLSGIKEFLSTHNVAICVDGGELKQLSITRPKKKMQRKSKQ